MGWIVNAKPQPLFLRSDTEPSVQEAGRAQDRREENFAQEECDPRNVKSVASHYPGGRTNNKTQHSLKKAIIRVSQCEPIQTLNQLPSMSILLVCKSR